jgi:hypothetical protein
MLRRTIQVPRVAASLSRTGLGGGEIEPMMGSGTGVVVDVGSEDLVEVSSPEN